MKTTLQQIAARKNTDQQTAATSLSNQQAVARAAVAKVLGGAGLNGIEMFSANAVNGVVSRMVEVLKDANGMDAIFGADS